LFTKYATGEQQANLLHSLSKYFFKMFYLYFSSEK
jgi:hypothetical protein